MRGSVCLTCCPDGDPRLKPATTRPAPAATDTGLEPWGYGWFELGGKKMASGYLPTVNYPRSENVTEGPFPLYTRSQVVELLAEKDVIIRSHLATIASFETKLAASEEARAALSDEIEQGN
ncbi:hypothetical protein F9K91_02250 [Brucella tritici]|uniref:Uncharacterized protein n=1 Tax=Brucella tritici TaxID=94626 RepID=A0A833CRT3_9HYPH|nr:hypothetical protein [Brucella tritici]KAB2666781.1 hypothetical protein F9K91_02250 [Brucella tritici]